MFWTYIGPKVTGDKYSKIFLLKKKIPTSATIGEDHTNEDVVSTSCDFSIKDLFFVANSKYNSLPNQAKHIED